MTNAPEKHAPMTANSLKKRVAEAISNVQSLRRASHGKRIGWTDAEAGVSMWPEQISAWKELLQDAELGAMLRELPVGMAIERLPQAWGLRREGLHQGGGVSPDAVLQMALLHEAKKEKK